MNKKRITLLNGGLLSATGLRATRGQPTSLTRDLVIGLMLVVAVAAGSRAAFSLPEAFILSGVGVYATIAVVIVLWRQGSALGPADRVTLLRAVVVCVFAGLLPQAELLAGHAWLLVALAAVCLILDGVDGWVARRGGAESDFGARFDMELDAFFLVVLAAMVSALGKTGAWVLLIGLLRYVFVAAGWLLPWLQAPLPPSRRRKAVCVVQGVVLVAVLAPVIPQSLGVVALAVALASLCYSFILDILWLWSRAGKSSETATRARCTEQDG